MYARIIIEICSMSTSGHWYRAGSYCIGCLRWVMVNGEWWWVVDIKHVVKGGRDLVWFGYPDF